MAIQTKQMALLGLPSVLENGYPYHRAGGAKKTNGGHLDQEPSNVTIPGNNLPYECTMWGAATKIGNINAIGLVNHTLDRYRGSYFSVVSLLTVPTLAGALTPVHWKNYYPTSLDASSNLTGTYTAIDDSPFSNAGESDYVTNAGAGAWSARFGFATPSSPALSATAVANDQLFTIRIGEGAASSDTVTVKLYENNVLLATLADAIQFGDNDPLGRKVLSFPWSSSLLSTADGSNVQVQIESADSVVLYSVVWTCAPAIESFGDDRAYYSGWVQIPGFDSSTSLGGLDPELVGEEPVKTDLFLFDRTLDFTTSPDGFSPLVGVSFAQASNTDEPVSLGVLLAGTVFRPERNFTTLSLGVHDESKKQRTLGGQDIISSRNRRRYATFTIPLVKRSQFAQLFERIDFRKGSTGAFLVSFFPEDDLDDVKRLTTFYATLTQEADQPWVISGVKIGGTDEDTVPFRFEKTYSIEEKL